VGRRTSGCAAALLALTAVGCSDSAYIGLRELDRESDGRGVELSYRGEGTILLQAEDGRFAPSVLAPAEVMDASEPVDMGADEDPAAGDAGTTSGEPPRTADEANLCFRVDADDYTTLFFSVYPTAERDVILTARFYVDDDDDLDDDERTADCTAVDAQRSARLRLSFEDGGTATTPDAGGSTVVADAGVGDPEPRDSGTEPGDAEVGRVDASMDLMDSGTEPSDAGQSADTDAGDGA